MVIKNKPGDLYISSDTGEVYECTAGTEHTKSYKLFPIKSVSFESTTLFEEDKNILDTHNTFTIEICGDIFTNVRKTVDPTYGTIKIGDVSIYGICIYINTDGVFSFVKNPEKYAKDLTTKYELNLFAEDVQTKASNDWKLLDNGKNPYINNFWITDFNRFCESGSRVDYINKLTTSKGTYFLEMFYNASSLTSIPELDTSKAAGGMAFFGMFYNCAKIKSIPKLDTSKGTKFINMFYGCSSLISIPKLDTSNGTGFEAMFQGCSSLTSIPKLDTSKGTKFTNMFTGCSSLTSIPELDTSKGENFDAMFTGCSSLTSIPKLNTSNGTSFQSTIKNCTSLTSIPELDTSNAKTLYSFLYGCSSLTSIPELDTSSVTSFSSMFQGCSSLTSIPELDTSKGTDFNSMFYGCSSLTSISELDIIKGTSFSNMFYGCSVLTDLHIKNIKRTLQIGSGTTYGHLLTLESLLFIIGQLISSSSSSTYTLTIGSANLKKLANVYVKTIEITDEMRAADANIDAKRPFEVCESTDEGAMLITNYASEKKWLIK